MWISYIGYYRTVFLGMNIRFLSPHASHGIIFIMNQEVSSNLQAAAALATRAAQFLGLPYEPATA
jgi:hypothetical protein